ncbi:hypothetical protein BS329_11145 [Amycolatopsis coloradensis]|uniref:Uncharacterized protein n=1 Tax=Amycolatopsis coloradensis TaxID=76021 RepID=A0A1R0KWK8_9PSEU|nr:hypothetical protein BS329_11145 [Amycolatopsis coloradensis]
MEEVTHSLKLLDIRDSAAVAASEGIALRFRALARLSQCRESTRSVTQEVAFALSLVDGHAGAMVATAEARSGTIFQPFRYL